MENTVTSLKIAAGAGCLTLALGGVGLFAAAAANATGGKESGADETGHTPLVMEIATSADAQIRTTGTQGTFASAQQCTDLSSVKVGCVTQSFEATPQVKSPNKMTK